MIDLRHLQELITISEHDSLSEAARELYITQPALSRSMHKLETELGVTLFDHKTNKVVLNQTGKMAVSYARAIFSQIEDMQEKLRVFNRLVTTISVGSCSVGPMWNLVPDLSSRFPNMTVSSEIDVNSDHLIQLLKSQEYKLIITTAQVIGENILSVQYVSEQLCLAVPEDHELADCDGIHMKDLKAQTLVQYANTGLWRQYLDLELQSSNLIYIENYSDFLEIVKSAPLPYFTTDIGLKLRPHPQNRRRIPVLDESASVTYYCSCLKENKKYLPTKAI